MSGLGLSDGTNDGSEDLGCAGDVEDSLLLIPEFLHRHIKELKEVGLLELLHMHEDPLPLLPLSYQNWYEPSWHLILPSHNTLLSLLPRGIESILCLSLHYIQLCPVIG